MSRRIVDVLEEGVVVLDESGRVVACNPSAERIMGFDVGALLGRRPPFQPCFFADGTAVDAATARRLPRCATAGPTVTC